MACLRRRTLFAFIAFLLVLPRPASAETTLWPLGDSITYGETVQGGYRDRHYQNLTAAGFGGAAGFRFVGTTTINPSPLLTATSQARHEGHRGYRIDEISSNLNGSDNSTVYDDTNHGGYWLTGGPGGTLIPSTDVILLLIGTNDFIQNRDLPKAGNRLDALVGKITMLRPNANLLVSNIPPLTTSIYGAHDVTGYNASIPGIVNKYAALGRHVSFVDQYSNFFDTGGNLRYLQSDGTHPNAAGSNAMADTWARALQNIPEPGALTLTTAILGLVRRGSRRLHT
jgi:hypothetical protein